MNDTSPPEEVKNVTFDKGKRKCAFSLILNTGGNRKKSANLCEYIETNATGHFFLSLHTHKSHRVKIQGNNLRCYGILCHHHKKHSTKKQNVTAHDFKTYFFTPNLSLILEHHTTINCQWEYHNKTGSEE